MKIKANEATVSRPSGSRLLDASSVKVDIKKCIESLKSEEAWQLNDRNAITVFKSDGITMVLSGMHPNAVIDDYSRGGISIIYVIQGNILFTTGGEEKEVAEGQIISAQKEETFLLLTMKD